MARQLRGSWLRPHIQLAKYLAIGRVTVKTRTAYVLDFALRQMFLVIVIFTFSQLWKATFASVGRASIEGFSQAQMLWYLVLTESIMLGMPRAASTMDSEVKSGQIAYTLIRPYSFLLYHYASFLGEACVRVPLNILMGGAVALATVGRIDVSLVSILSAMVSFVLGITIHFTISTTIGLLAFWFEDTASFQLLYSRAVLLLGGVILPIDLFPPVIREVARYLPTSLVAYGPAKVFTSFGIKTSEALGFIGLQCVWILILSGLLYFVYQIGVKRTNVQGG